jgi:hypothetical protein
MLYIYKGGMPAALAAWTTEGWIQEQHPCLCGKESTLDVCRSANVYVQTQLLFEQINGIYSTRDFVLRVIGKGIIVVLYPFQILCSFEKPPIILHMAVDVKVGNLVL